jgi:hypothetical protein
MAPYSMIPALHLSKEIVRRPVVAAAGNQSSPVTLMQNDDVQEPAIEASTALHARESATASSSLQEQASDQIVLVCRVAQNLGGCYMPTHEYNSIYGIISPEFPWGHSIWQGLRTEIRIGMQHRWQGGPQDYMMQRAMGGYFRCPQPFSRSNALVPSTGQESLHYPVVFVQVEEEVYIMWCLAIVIRRSRGWWVHRSRACVWAENTYFDDLLMP